MSAIPALATLDDRERIVSAQRFAPLLLAAWWSFLFIYGVNSGELYRNEGLRARIAQEMLAGGDWIVPHLYGEPIFTKPPLLYWAICLFSLPLGEVTVVTARLPSILGGFGLSLLFLWTFRRCLGRNAGWLAAMIAPCSIFWLEKVPSAEIDALHVFWVTASILLLVRALEAEESQEQTLRWWLLASLCLAAGTLTKWTAPAFFYLAAFSLFWQRGKLRLLLGQGHLCLFIVAVTLVAGWIIATIARTDAELFWTAVMGEAAPRLMPGRNPKPYPWLETLLHPLIVFAATLPLSLGVFWGGAPANQSRSDLNQTRAQRLLQALHCWLWPSLLFWTVHPDHTLRNRAPLFPAIAGLAVFACLRLEHGWKQRGRQLPSWTPRGILTGFLIVWMVLKAVHIELVLPRRAADRQVVAKAAHLAGYLPDGCTLYLFRIKDECLFFYLNHPAIRLSTPDNLPNTQHPVFCILTDGERRAWDPQRAMRLVTQTHDGQGDPVYLIEVLPQSGQ